MTLYRFHGRITVEREESLSHLLYERMSIMYKVELKFDTSKLAPETVNQMCEQADQIFEQEDLSCAVKALGSRIYLDRGRKAGLWKILGSNLSVEKLRRNCREFVRVFLV